MTTNNLTNLIEDDDRMPNDWKKYIPANVDELKVKIGEQMPICAKHYKGDDSWALTYSQSVSNGTIMVDGKTFSQLYPNKESFYRALSKNTSEKSKQEMNKIYKNSTEIAQVSGIPIYMNDVVDSCLMGRLNLFLQGDTGSGKTQLAADAMSYFPGKSLFVLGRNDMDVRELFQQINLDKMRSAKSSQELKELTDKINYNLTVVDELPNCVPAVRAQLFNLFDGYIELNGQKYDIGNGYSVGIATGNIGQKFTESSNELGRALKDRMHVIVDTDHYKPQPPDTLEILAGNTNPRVEFIKNSDKSAELIAKADALKTKEVPFEKYIVATYLTHGLDYCTVGGQPASKTKIKDAWPNSVDNNAQGSDEALILPVSVRAAKSIIRLSQAFDEIAKEKGAKSVNPFSSMMQAYKLVSAYSGILNDAAVQANYAGDKYAAMDAIITTTNEQFEQQKDNIAAGLDMANKGKLNKKVTDLFSGRWGFMKNTLEGLIQNTKSD